MSGHVAGGGAMVKLSRVLEEDLHLGQLQQEVRFRLLLSRAEREHPEVLRGGGAGLEIVVW